MSEPCSSEQIDVKREEEIMLHWVVVQNKSDCRSYYSEILDLIIVRWEKKQLIKCWNTFDWETFKEGKH